MNENQVIFEAWKQAIAVQMHFNEMVMKLRAIALTLVAALITTEGLAKDAGGAALAAALVVWLAFYLMDRFWYHCLLIGAVLYGRALECHADEILKLKFPPNTSSRNIYSGSLLGLADYIGQANQEHWKWRVNRKIDTYYGLVALALFIILLARLLK